MTHRLPLLTSRSALLALLACGCGTPAGTNPAPADAAVATSGPEAGAPDLLPPTPMGDMAMIPDVTRSMPSHFPVAFR